MNATQMINDLRATWRDERKRQARSRKYLAEARRLFAVIRALPSAGDIQYASLGSAYSWETTHALEIDLTLNESKRDSALVRELVRATGQPASKRKRYDNTIVAAIFVGMVRLQVCGYKPETCVLVTEPVQVPVEIDDITCQHCAQPVATATTDCPNDLRHTWTRTEQKTKMVCSPTEQVEA